MGPSGVCGGEGHCLRRNQLSSKEADSSPSASTGTVWTQQKAIYRDKVGIFQVLKDSDSIVIYAERLSWVIFNKDSIEGREGHKFFLILPLERWNKFVLPLNLSWSYD